MTVAFAGALCCAPIVHAQSIVGRVVLADSTTPAAQVIVSAQHADGRTIRALTTSSGRFELRVDTPGRYTLQILRVGFTPTPKVTFDVGNGAANPVIIIAESPAVSLAAVAVTSARVCRISRDTGAVVSRIWEEARKALLSTVLRSAETPLMGEWMAFDRVTDTSGRFVRDQRLQVERHPTQRVFKSVSGDSLAHVGYVVEEADGIAFHAPDADVFLHDSFAETHCFGLRDSSTAAPVIGLTFTPARERRGFHDIAGVIWLDRNSAELRALDFAYTGLPDVALQFAGGGRIEFAVLADIGWMVRSWYARMPVMVAGRSMALPGTSANRRGTFAPVVERIGVTGGELSKVSRGDTVLLQRALSTLRAQLVYRDGSIPSSGATVFLAGTNIAEPVDATGRVRVGPLPSGRYTVRVAVPGADSLGIPLVERDITVNNGERIDTLVVQPVEELITAMCARDTLSAGSALLRGTVRKANGVPAVNARVLVSFYRVDARALGAGMVSAQETTLEMSTDERGQWRTCGIPLETDLTITVLSDTQAGSRRTRIALARMFAVVDMQLAVTAPPQ